MHFVVKNFAVFVISVDVLTDSVVIPEETGNHDRSVIAASRIDTVILMFK
jgi:hypothetical protein